MNDTMTPGFNNNILAPGNVLVGVPNPKFFTFFPETRFGVSHVLMTSDSEHFITICKERIHKNDEIGISKMWLAMSVQMVCRYYW